ncbi:MAG: hypothetical protein K8I02_08145 [Candidatus Methylomirabilis sp.]|nr:hypothetical protein [Deltaproteobacteria bacterium]
MHRPNFTNREWFIVLVLGFPAMFLGMYMASPKEPSPKPLLEIAEEYQAEGRRGPTAASGKRFGQEALEAAPTLALTPRWRRGTVYTMGAVIVVVIAAMIGWIWYE